MHTLFLSYLQKRLKYLLAKIRHGSREDGNIKLFMKSTLLFALTAAVAWLYRTIKDKPGAFRLITTRAAATWGGKTYSMNAPFHLMRLLTAFHPQTIHLESNLCKRERKKSCGLELGVSLCYFDPRLCVVGWFEFAACKSYSVLYYVRSLWLR